MEHLNPGWVLPPWSLLLAYESSLVPSELPNKWIELCQSFDSILCDPKLLNGLKCQFKVKTSDGQRVGACSLARNTFGGRGACWSSGMGTRKSDKQVNYSYEPAQTTQQVATSWLVRSYNIFGARTSHRQIRIHNIHHGLDLGEATTFPLIVFFVPDHGPTLKCHFISGLQIWSPEIP
jgi:hypothetical protein